MYLFHVLFLVYPYNKNINIKQIIFIIDKCISMNDVYNIKIILIYF